MQHLGRWLNLWFTFERSVGRRVYLLSGLGLAALKYAGDVLIVWRGTGRLWHPLDYLSPVSSLASQSLVSGWSFVLLALWALPFLWIGISMSMRRSLDAGHSAWLALLFFIPGINYLFMAAMCAPPTSGEPVHVEETPRAYGHRP